MGPLATKGCDFGELNEFAEVRLKGLVQAWGFGVELCGFFWKDGWKLKDNWGGGLTWITGVVG